MIRTSIFALLLLCQTAFSADVQSPAEFADSYLKKLEQTYPDTSATLTDEMTVSVKMPNEQTFTAYLDNAYMEYQADPTALDAVLATYIATLGTHINQQYPDQSLPNLVPVIKHPDYVAEAEARTAALSTNPDIDNRLYYEEINSELVVIYAFDSELSLSFASREDIKDLGVELSGLRGTAIQNLDGRLPPIERHGDNSLAMLTADGNFESSLLLFDGIWNAENFPVAGDIVVFVPSRDVLLITGSEDQEGLSKARELVANNEWPYLISLEPFVRQGDSWALLDK